MNNLTLVIPAKKEAESLPHVLQTIKDLNLSCKIKVCLSPLDEETVNALKDGFLILLEMIKLYFKSND